MKYFLISVSFAVLLPLIRLALANSITVSNYAYIVSIWGVSSLIGSQLFGAYPRLYPDAIKKYKNEIIIDFESIFLCISLLICYSFWLCQGEALTEILLSVVLCAIHSGLYEYYAVKSTVTNKANTLLYAEIFNFLPISILLVSYEFFHFSFSYFVFSYSFSIIILFVFFYENRINLTWFKKNNDIVLNKFSLLVAQSNIFLLPSLMLLFFSKSFSGLFSVTYYILNLVASFNQLLVNRVCYADGRFNLIRLIILFSFVIIQSCVLSLIIDYGLLRFMIKDYLVSGVGFIVVFLFLFSRLAYNFSFIFSRFNKIDAILSTWLESMRFILFFCGLYILSIVDCSIQNVFLLIATSYFFATFFYAYFVFKVKKNVSRSMCVNIK